MASVELNFIAPDVPDLDKLLVFEATTADGPFIQVAELDGVGTYPDYIDHYSVENVNSVDDWFTIQWITVDGVKSEMSVPIKGDSETLVGIVAGRVRQRDRSLSYAVIVQEAEVAVERYFGQNPYSIDPTDVSYRVLNGLTYLALARTLTVNQSQGTADRVTIGLTTVASSSGAQVSQKAIDELLDLARGELGLDSSLVLQMAELDNAELTTMILEP